MFKVFKVLDVYEYKIQHIYVYNKNNNNNNSIVIYCVLTG